MESKAIELLKWIGVGVIILVSILVASEAEASTIPEEEMKSGISTLIMAALICAVVAVFIREGIKRIMKDD